MLKNQRQTSTTVADSSEETFERKVVRPKKAVAQVTISEEHEKFLKWLDEQKSEHRLKKGKFLNNYTNSK